MQVTAVLLFFHALCRISIMQDSVSLAATYTRSRPMAVVIRSAAIRAGLDLADAGCYVHICYTDDAQALRLQSGLEQDYCRACCSFQINVSKLILSLPSFPLAYKFQQPVYQ